LAFAVVGFVAFEAFDGLRALPRAVAAFLCCAFACFLRLAMIDPPRSDSRSAKMPDHQIPATYQTSYQQIAA
jgi:hypothetical protein